MQSLESKILTNKEKNGTDFFLAGILFIGVQTITKKNFHPLGLELTSEVEKIKMTSKYQDMEVINFEIVAELLC